MKVRKNWLGFCFLLFISQSIFIRGDEFLRRIRNDLPEKIPEFFKFDPRSGQEPQELRKLNQGIYEYILKNFGVRVVDPPKPIPLDPTEMSSYGSYRFKQRTDQGEYDIVVKQADVFIKEGFLKASELGIAPQNAEFVESKFEINPVRYETIGYVISYFFKGDKLSDFVFHVNRLLDNPWIFESLGIKLANLKKAGIEYRERIESNVLIDIEGKDLKIVGYGNFGARDPAEQIYSFINIYLKQELKRMDKEEFADAFWLIFKNAYNSQLPPEMRIP
ncbi:MAG: hypothetical protein NC920_03575 [Candidatus Omnitrophica bacterium]|nr:hypothetical protein [Candidatus Omnitrophota bacterium]MCM8798353.1 hypothetical protein [Candidatus Omnitrophota bacterium]